VLFRSGREPQKKTARFSDSSGRYKEVQVETFPWEKLDYVDKVKAAFGL